MASKRYLLCKKKKIMPDYQVVNIGNKERKEHPLLEKAMKIIESSEFFRKYGNPSKLPYYGIDEYGPIWIHQTNSYGIKIMIHVKCPSKIRTVDDAFKYRQTPYYQELCNAVKGLADYVNSQLGMKLATRATMTANDHEAMVYVDESMLKNSNDMNTINESDIRKIVAESLKDFFRRKKKFEGKELNWTLHTTGMNSTVYLKGFADSEEWIDKGRVVIRCKSIVLGNARKYKLTNAEITIINSTNVLVSGVNEETGENLSFKRLILDKTSLMENFTGEYRTKGSLNKKTLEKNAGKSPEDIIADREQKAAETADYNPDWDESAEDILSRFHDEETYDDSSAGGEYQIDFDDPYFYMDGKRVSADAIGNFHNDFAIVKKDGKCNYVDSNGELLSKEMWFDACKDFEDGFGLVSKDRKRNFIKDDGQLLLDVWVDRAGDFLSGCAPVIINGERHEVDREGNIR